MNVRNSKHSVWETEQKMVQFSARSDYRRSGCLVGSVQKARPLYKYNISFIDKTI